MIILISWSKLFCIGGGGSTAAAAEAADDAAAATSAAAAAAAAAFLVIASTFRNIANVVTACRQTYYLGTVNKICNSA